MAGARIESIRARRGIRDVHGRLVEPAPGLHARRRRAGLVCERTELFYRDGRKLIAAQLETHAGFVIVRRDTVFADIYQLGNNRAACDVMPDGQSFIMVRPTGAGSLPMIVLNWFDELRERMAQASKP